MEDKSYLSVEEITRGEPRALFPETDRRRVRIGEHEISLRPLPIIYERRLLAIARRAIEAWTKASAGADGGSALGAVTAAEVVGEALQEGAAVIAQFYALEGVDAKWIGEHLDDGEIFSVITAQLESCSENSAFRRGLLPLLRLMHDSLSAIEGADFRGVTQQATKLFDSPGRLAPTPASASPGASPSASSSNDTPRDSSS